jgi:hypothetical protein
VAPIFGIDGPPVAITRAGASAYLVAIGDTIAPVRMADVADRPAERDPHRTPGALVHQHRDDLARGAVAEELTQRLLVPGDAVLLDQREEILRGVAAQRRLDEMRVGRQVAVRRGAEISEVAAPAAGDQDLLARLIGMIDHQHPPPALPGDAAAISPAPPAPRMMASYI